MSPRSLECTTCILCSERSLENKFALISGSFCNPEPCSIPLYDITLMNMLKKLTPFRSSMHQYQAWKLLAVSVILCSSLSMYAEEWKPRLVVLTDIAPNDIEPDDMESLIRLLAHADLFEI